MTWVKNTWNMETKPFKKMVRPITVTLHDINKTQDL